MHKLIQIVVQGRHGVHIFRNPQGLKWLLLRWAAYFRSQDNFNLSASKYLFQQLQHCSFNHAWLMKVETPLYYRRVGRHRDVLDTAGSMGDGGRHNLGSAQTSSHTINAFAPLGAKRSALYLGEDPIVVRKEFGDEGVPGSKAVTYAVSLKRRKSILLIDTEKVLKDLVKSIPDIKEVIGTASMNGKWVDLKQPAPCQIFGHWLIHSATKRVDGIRFPTAHGSGSWNVCLYFPDTKACKKMLKAVPLS